MGSLSSSYNQAVNPSISNLYNSALRYGSGGVAAQHKIAVVMELYSALRIDVIAESFYSVTHCCSSFSFLGATGNRRSAMNTAL